MTESYNQLRVDKTEPHEAKKDCTWKRSQMASSYFG